MDHTRGRALFTAAVAGGHPLAHAHSLFFGWCGQAQNYEAAFKLFSDIAAAGGDSWAVSEAARLLGDALLGGKGVARDDVAGYKWSLRAAARGNSSAQGVVSQCLFRGVGVEKDALQGFKWAMKAAEDGYRCGPRRRTGTPAPAPGCTPSRPPARVAVPSQPWRTSHRCS